MIQIVFECLKGKERREIEESWRYPLEMRLKENIIGQEGAILTVAAGIIFYATNQFGRLQFGNFGSYILLNLFFICLQQFVEEKMVGMMRNIPLCFSFLDLQELVNFGAFLEHI